MDFISLDFETANWDLASVCQIGLVRFRNGKVAEKFGTLINPDDEFSEINIAIHGITEDQVQDSPKFPEIYPEACRFMEGQTVVCHTHFDRSVWNILLEEHELPEINITWLDSARVARRAWSQYAKSGFGLSNVANDLGIEFNHHDAVEDARAAGLIIIKACDETNLDIEGWLTRVKKPINPSASSSEPVKREGNAEGKLYGETAVFTGALSIPRHQAADLAAFAGCDVGASVTKKTTLLIVGDQDIRRFAPGQKKSSKQMKAEKLISEGQKIRIVKESNFIKLVDLD